MVRGVEIENRGKNGEVSPELTGQVVSLVNSVVEWNIKNTVDKPHKLLDVLVIDGTPPFVYKRFHLKGSRDGSLKPAYAHYRINTASGQVSNIGIVCGDYTQGEVALAETKYSLKASGIRFTSKTASK